MSDEPITHDDDDETFPKSPEQTQRDLAKHEGKPLTTDDGRRPDLSPADLDVASPWPTHKDRPEPSDTDGRSDGDADRSPGQA